MTSFCEVAICGGGIPGLTLACLLGQAGVDTVVIDPSFPARTPAVDTRTAALLNPAVAILEQAGIDTADAGWPLAAIRLIDGRQPDLDNTFPARDIGAPHYGLNMPNANLRWLLHKRARALKPVRLMETALTSLSVEGNRAALALDNGKTLETLLVIGADGRYSKVREQAGIALSHSDTGQTAITAVLRHARAHQQTSTEIHYPGGPLTFVPMDAGRSALVWIDDTSRHDRRVKIPRAAFTAQLNDMSLGILGHIDVDSALHHWPLALQTAKRLTAPRVALMAEAAHVMPPTGAQGLNVSLGDTRFLAGMITRAIADGTDPGQPGLLASYETGRMPEIWARGGSSRFLNTMIRRNDGVGRSARRITHRLMAASPTLRHALMRAGLAV